MRFDLLTIFPEFFTALDLSLVGKAKERGLIEIGVHNLRDWTHDVHNSVDDTPFGGGAGMVMKADVWAAAIDQLTTDSTAVLKNQSSLEQGAVNEQSADTASFANQIVLAIPSPAGKQLKQADLNHLAKAQQIVIACGRYEGIDARVAQYYAAQPGFVVFEFSLGDYVLNGGEVAAIALIEGISRLLPGMVGNPESLVEESHGVAGLLEYPSYTRPADFRGYIVPEILTSGNHGAIARWRKDCALERTANRRPDMLLALESAGLDPKDRLKLATLDWFVPQNALHPMRVKYRPAICADVFRLSEFASRTWPDACPAEMKSEDINAFVRENLNPEVFARYLAEPERYLVYLAEIDALNCDDSAQNHEIVAYLLIEISHQQNGVVAPEAGAPADFVYDGLRRDGPLIYLSKAYVDRAWRGSGIFAAFAKWGFAQAAAQLQEFVAPFIWLGTAIQNKRAQRAYRSLGFQYAGKREFIVGDQINKDVTMARPLNMAE